jgi:hypothetical protein
MIHNYLWCDHRSQLLYKTGADCVDTAALYSNSIGTLWLQLVAKSDRSARECQDTADSGDRAFSDVIAQLNGKNYPQGTVRHRRRRKTKGEHRAPVIWSRDAVFGYLAQE